jgi:hypothetical protein
MRSAAFFFAVALVAAGLPIWIGTYPGKTLGPRIGGRYPRPTDVDSAERPAIARPPQKRSRDG